MSLPPGSQFFGGKIKIGNDINLSNSATTGESSCVTAHEIRNKVTAVIDSLENRKY